MELTLQERGRVNHLRHVPTFSIFFLYSVICCILVITCEKASDKTRPSGPAPSNLPLEEIFSAAVLPGSRIPAWLPKELCLKLRVSFNYTSLLFGCQNS